MQDELKACPFCGGGNVTVGAIGMTEKFLGISHSDTNRWFVRVQCLDCGTKRGYDEAHPLSAGEDARTGEAAQAAIAAWNTRADPALAAAQAEVARCLTCIEGLAQERATLQADRERLREALTEIKASPHSGIANNGYQSPRQIATQALGE